MIGCLGNINNLTTTEIPKGTTQASKGPGVSMKDVIENGFSTVWGSWAGSFNEEIQSVGEVMTIPSSLVKET